MLKKLDELGLVTHEPYRGVRLTADGRRVALEVIRHHRLLERFLADALGMPWDRVHAEAEVLEHVLSDELEELIATKLGNPAVGPARRPDPERRPRAARARDAQHGEPHARGPGRVRARLGLRPGDAALPRELRHLARRAASRCATTSRSAGPLFVRFGEREHAIGGRLAAAMRVEVSSDATGAGGTGGVRG